MAEERGVLPVLRKGVLKMTEKANEIIQKALEQVSKYGCMMFPVCVNKTVGISPVDKELEKEIKRIASENSLEVWFETKSHKVTMVHGYRRVGNAPVTSSYTKKARTMGFVCRKGC